MILWRRCARTLAFENLCQRMYYYYYYDCYDYYYYYYTHTHT